MRNYTVARVKKWLSSLLMRMAYKLDIEQVFDTFYDLRLAKDD